MFYRFVYIFVFLYNATKISMIHIIVFEFSTFIHTYLVRINLFLLIPFEVTQQLILF